MIIVISDIHFGDQKGEKVKKKIFLKLMSKIRKVNEQAVGDASKPSIKTMVFLGDCIDFWRSSSFKLFKKVVKNYFQPLSQIPGLEHIYICAGNHDLTLLNTAFPFIKLFKDINVEVVEHLFSADTPGLEQVKIEGRPLFFTHGYQFENGDDDTCEKRKAKWILINNPMFWTSDLGGKFQNFFYGIYLWFKDLFKKGPKIEEPIKVKFKEQTQKVLPKRRIDYRAYDDMPEYLQNYSPDTALQEKVLADFSKILENARKSPKERFKMKGDEPLPELQGTNYYKNIMVTKTKLLNQNQLEKEPWIVFGHIHMLFFDDVNYVANAGSWRQLVKPNNSQYILIRDDNTWQFFDGFSLGDAW